MGTVFIFGGLRPNTRCQHVHPAGDTILPTTCGLYRRYFILIFRKAGRRYPLSINHTTRGDGHGRDRLILQPNRRRNVGRTGAGKIGPGSA